MSELSWVRVIFVSFAAGLCTGVGILLIAIARSALAVSFGRRWYQLRQL